MKKLQGDRKISEIALLMRERIESSGKTLNELAIAMGYNKGNIISMMKNGDTKVPINKAVVIAQALNIDPNYFIRLALRQWFADELDPVWEFLDGIVSANETKLIRAVRDAYDDKVPSFTKSQIEEAVALLTELNPPKRA